MLQSPILIDQNLISGKCPARPSAGHKGTFGRVLICAGSVGMGGAACMATSSALRSGAGLVYVLTEKELLSPLLVHCPEALGLFFEEKTPAALPASMAAPAVMTIPLAPAKPGFDAFYSEQLYGKDACLIGPGIPTSSDKIDSMLRIAAKEASHLVLDAGALSYLASHEEVMQEISARRSRGLSPAALTPHTGEFARFVPGFTGREIARAGAFAEEKGVILVLKNNETNVFTPDGKWYSNSVSNSGLAKGGSGDVLAGLLTGLLAQGMTEEDASVCAVGIHSLAGQYCAKEHGVRAMLPTMLWQYYDRCFKLLKWEEGMENDG